MAKQVFNGPAFADVLTNGDLPDRDDFKDRFVTGLLDVIKASDFWEKRGTYASLPKFVPGQVEQEIEVIPTTACL